MGLHSPSATEQHCVICSAALCQSWVYCMCR